MKDKITYQGHEIQRDPADGRYWLYAPKEGVKGFSGRVYASLKEAKKSIKLKIDNAARIERAAAKAKKKINRER